MTYTDGLGRPYKVALDRYETRRVRKPSGGHDVEKCLPEEPGPAHATSSFATMRMRAGAEPHFAPPPFYESTLCGASGKVILTVDFDPGDPDACPTCAAEIVSDAPRKKNRRLDEYEREMARQRPANTPRVGDEPTPP